MWPIAGVTPLHVCARAGLEDCMRLLLEHGASAAAVDALGLTAEQHARLFDHSSAAALLAAARQPAPN